MIEGVRGRGGGGAARPSNTPLMALQGGGVTAAGPSDQQYCPNVWLDLIIAVVRAMTTMLSNSSLDLDY